METLHLIPRFDSILNANTRKDLSCSLRNLKVNRGLQKQVHGKRQILIPDTWANTIRRRKMDSSQGDAVGKSPSVQLRRSLDPGDFPRRAPPGSTLRLKVGSPLRCPQPLGELQPAGGRHTDTTESRRPPAAALRAESRGSPAARRHSSAGGLRRPPRASTAAAWLLPPAGRSGGQAAGGRPRAAGAVSSPEAARPAARRGGN